MKLLKNINIFQPKQMAHKRPEKLEYFYNSKIARLAFEYKQCVQMNKSTDWINMGLVIFVITVFACLMEIMEKIGGGAATIFTIIFCIVIAIYSNLITNQLEPVLSEFRNKAIPIMLTYFDANLTYLERDSIENYRLKSFGIYLSFDSKKTTGYVYGYYKNLDIQMMSTSLLIEEDEGFDEIFKGLIIIVKLKQQLVGTTVASSCYHKNYKNLPRVHLTNSVFNSEFYVSTDDKNEASTFITTSFLKGLHDLEKQTGLKLTFSFNEGALLISIPTVLPDFSFYWGDLRYDYNNIMECMQLILDVIDILQLDHDA